MMKHNTTQRHGFTIVELIVVIVVIGILASVVALGFGRYNAAARDERRASSVAAISESLEKYYNENGEYPGCPSVTAAISTVTSTTLQGVERSALIAPSASDKTANSLKCTTLVLSGDDFYEYTGDGSATCATGTSCLSYSLKYKKESTDEVKTVVSRYNTSITTSGVSTLTANGSPTFTTVPLRWTAIPNAVSYVIQRASTCGNFSGATETPVPDQLTGTVTGLPAGNTSCYRVVGKSSTGGTTEASNTLSRTTANLTGDVAPTFNSGSSGFFSLALQWTAMSGAQTYDIEYRTTTGFTGTPTVTGVTGTTRTLSSLSYDTLYYAKVRAVAVEGATTIRSGWSSTADESTLGLSTPIPSVGSPTASSVTLSWGSIANASTYEIEQQSTSSTSFTGTPTSTGITGTSSVRSGLSVGTTYYFKVRARAVSGSTPVYSDWSSSVTGNPTPPSPSTPSIAWTNNYGSTSHSATCSTGSAQFSRATTYRTDGSKADAFGSWSAWTTGSTFASDFIAEGMYGKAKVKAKCVLSGAESAEVESATIDRIRPIDYITAGTWYNRVTSPALIGVGGACVGGSTEMYKYGQIYHGSAGTHAGGGWGQWGDFQITNGPPNWSSGDNLNTYRVSRTICRTPYYERSIISAVAGATLQGTGASQYSGFVNAGYTYGGNRI